MLILNCIHIWRWLDSTYIVLGQIRVVPLYAIIQYGDHHILAGIAPLPGCQNVHICATVAALIIAVLKTKIDNKHQTSCLVKMKMVGIMIQCSVLTMYHMLVHLGSLK